MSHRVRFFKNTNTIRVLLSFLKRITSLKSSGSQESWVQSQGPWHQQHSYATLLWGSFLNKLPLVGRRCIKSLSLCSTPGPSKAPSSYTSAWQKLSPFQTAPAPKYLPSLCSLDLQPPYRSLRMSYLLSAASVELAPAGWVPVGDLLWAG